MKVLTVYANPNPRSFCHAILEQFSQGLKDAGHRNEVVDLYAIRFNPVLKLWDYASWINETTPIEYLKAMIQSSTNRLVELWIIAFKYSIGVVSSTKLVKSQSLRTGLNRMA